MSEFTFNLNRRKSGRYYVNVNERGGPFRTNYSLLTSDKSTARQRLTRWERLHARGEWDPRDGAPDKGDRVPLSRAVDRFLTAYEGEVRQNTYKAMVGALNGLMKTVGETTPAGHVTAKDVREHLRDMSSYGDARPGTAADSTRRKTYGKLKRAFDWMVRQKLISEAPTDDVQRPKDATGDSYHVLTVGDARHLCRITFEQGPRWLLHMLELALSTGMRRGEIRHLTWGDVDTAALEGIDPTSLSSTDVVQVDVTPGPGDWQPKMDASERSITVYPRGSAVLRLRYDGQPDGELVMRRQDLGRLHSETVTDKFLRRMTKAAGLRPERDVTLHDMRHTWFTWLLNDLEMAKSVPTVSRMGGHSNIERTWAYVRAGEEGGEGLVLKSLGVQQEDGAQQAVQRWMCGAPTQVEMARSEGQLHK